MAILDLFSKRAREVGRAGAPDVFQYDEIPTALRVQCIHVWRDANGNPSSSYYKIMDCYAIVHDGLAREYGLFALGKSGDRQLNLEKFFLDAQHEQALDVIELMFRSVDHVARQYPSTVTRRRIDADDAIRELNARFLEHKVGYQYEGGVLVRQDSKLLHGAVVRPALVLLGEKRFRGANDEFLRAHEHYRHGRHKECLNDCLKAFESTMKSICSARKWAYPANATAKDLIDIVLANGLIPSFLQSHVGALRTTLSFSKSLTLLRLTSSGRSIITSGCGALRWFAPASPMATTREP